MDHIEKLVEEKISLKKEIESLKNQRDAAASAGEISRLNKEINLKTAELNLLLERYRK